MARAAAEMMVGRAAAAESDVTILVHGARYKSCGDDDPNSHVGGMGGVPLPHNEGRTIFVRR